MASGAELVEGIARGDRRALARLLTGIATGEVSEAQLQRLSRAKKAKVIAVTGPGGVGKSSLISRLIEIIRSDGQTVAVLACDPQSPVSGGALLGDRLRMPSRRDDGVFIRSLAALSGHGAVAEHLPAMLRVLEAFGFDVILVETVGAGQGDVAVAAMADLVLLLLQPEAGDELQWEKAGILELADVVAIQKADLPGAEVVAEQVRNSLRLSGFDPDRVVLVSAKTGKGVGELWRLLASIAGKRDQTARCELAELRAILTAWLERNLARLAEKDAQALAGLVDRWHRGQLTEDALVKAVVSMLVRTETAKPPAAGNAAPAQ